MNNTLKLKEMLIFNEIHKANTRIEELKRLLNHLSKQDQRIHDLEAALRTVYSQCKDGGHLTADWIGWEGIKINLPGVIDG